MVMTRALAKAINNSALAGEIYVLRMDGGFTLRIIGTKKMGGKQHFKTMGGNWMMYPLDRAMVDKV